MSTKRHFTSLAGAARNFLGVILLWLLGLRYTITVKGLDKIPCSREGKKGILFLPNHPAMIDPVILYACLAGLSPRALADARQMKGFLQQWIARFLRLIVIPDVLRDGGQAAANVKEGLKMTGKALQAGDNVLLYPSGQLYRQDAESLRANSAVFSLLHDVPDLRVVLVRTTGLWGSGFSYAATGKEPHFFKRLFAGLFYVLCNGIFFMPKRKVEIEFQEEVALSQLADKQTLNRYLEAYYNETVSPAVHIPYYFWHGHNPVQISSMKTDTTVKDLSAVPVELQAKVIAMLKRHLAIELPGDMLPEMLLGRDLGVDSLGMIEIASDLEQEFGQNVVEIASLETVGDCILAAAGQFDWDSGETKALDSGMPDQWRSSMEKQRNAGFVRVTPKASNFVDSFLALVRQNPGLAFLADESGSLTRLQVLVRVVLLSRRVTKIQCKRIGIMLPASPAGTIIWLAVLLAGKEPVMLNWTVGERNLRHCIELAEIDHVLTASQLMMQVQKSGLDLNLLPVTWMPLDQMAKSFSRVEQLRDFICAGLYAYGLPYRINAFQVPDVAALLFTSGSESAPKAVPLTHANMMANIADVTSVLGVEYKDSILAMLPPFHSLGLCIGMGIPAATGVAVAFYPNPTEPEKLLRLIQRYQLTLFGATPTFLDAMLKRARGTDAMNSIRYVFCGAEKCPEHVYRSFSQCCPQGKLCEGYGVTECSPVISVNRPDDTVPGSIGHPLPSLQIAIVKEEPAEHGSAARSFVVTGEKGVLLVRGPSVFSGYLGESSDPFVFFEGQKWYRTGDLVQQDDFGRLTFAGRLKRFVKIGGEMISLPQIENILQQELSVRIPEIDQGKPFIAVEVNPASEEKGQPEIVAFACFDTSAGELTGILRNAGLSPLYAIRRVVRLAEMPVLGSGKTDYQTLKSLA